MMRASWLTGAKAGSAALARRAGRWLRGTDRSIVMLEFGIIAVPFFAMFLGIMEISYDLFVQSELDNAVEVAARGVQVGAKTGLAGQTSADFIAKNVCPSISNALDCNLLTVAVFPIRPTGIDNNYYTVPRQTQVTQAQASGASYICTGKAGDLMVLKVWYEGPTFVGLLVPSFTKTWNGTVVHETMATAGFVNGAFTTGGQTAGSGCAI